MGTRRKPDLVALPWLHRSLAAAAAVAVGLVGSACATRLPMSDVSETEASAVRREIGAASLASVQADANRRYWDIFFSDSRVLAEIAPENRAALEPGPRDEVIQAMHEWSLAEWGVDALTVVRVSPGLLRAMAAEHPSDAGQYYAVATAAEQVQAPVVRRVHDVGERVLAASGRSDVEIVVDPEVGLNAMVPMKFDSRTMYVGPELALAAQSDDELACVMGHELAHISEGHTTSGAWANVGKQTLTALVATAALAAAAYGNQGAAITQQQVDGALALGNLTTFVLADVPLRLSGWNRGQESEADAMGLWYAKAAGYDPDACPRFMLRLAQVEAASGAVEGPRWWTIHPPTPERVVALRKLALDVKAGRVQPAEE